MKRAALGSLLAVLLALPLSGCHGPQRLSRGLDEWANNGYAELSWDYVLVDCLEVASIVPKARASSSAV